MVPIRISSSKKISFDIRFCVIAMSAIARLLDEIRVRIAGGVTACSYD